MRTRARLIPWVVLVLLFTALPAVAGPFTQLVVIGDSLADTGRLFALSDGAEPAEPYFDGRFSNGRVFAEYLASAFGLPLINYAVGGALTSHDNVAEVQYGDLPGMLTELDEFIGDNPGGADPNGLYVVWGGANDLMTLPPTPETIGDAVTNILTIVGTLQELGARHIAVANMPDLGLTPAGLASGSSAELTDLAFGFNQALSSALGDLPFPVVQVDIFTLSQRVAADPRKFGFTNVTEPCLDVVAGTLCSRPGKYAYWDGIHPTTAAHRILADTFAKAINQAIRRPRNN
jgi:phospholipase/lecithinase/hemolysin